VVFMLNERPPGKDFNILLQIRGRRIAVRVEVVHEETGQGGHRFGCKYVGLKADDWDAIVRYVNDTPEPENKAAEELKEQQQKPDDAYRVIPMAVQEKLVAILVKTNRLEPPAEGQAPALRMTYLGASKKADGTKLHNVTIHSRRQINDEWVAFDTQFRIDEAGNIEQQEKHH
ncbi:MAG TPA: PilZ domain-containing protein, partial [Candidatus Binatia bacterium]|nr:PilZ domain-containing protein [Candidatus Binatia bacterium]